MPAGEFRYIQTLSLSSFHGGGRRVIAGAPYWINQYGLTQGYHTHDEEMNPKLLYPMHFQQLSQNDTTKMHWKITFNPSRSAFTTMTGETLLGIAYQYWFGNNLRYNDE